MDWQKYDFFLNKRTFFIKKLKKIFTQPFFKNSKRLHFEAKRNLFETCIQLEKEGSRKLKRRLFLQIRIKPVDKVAMPKNAVLGMEDPVGLIREIEIASIQATELGSIIGSHALRSNDTEVELTMDYADRRIPFINKKVGRVGV